MTDGTYEVVFSGEVKKGFRRSVVQEKLRSRLKLSRREIRDLFSGRSHVIKRTAHQATAEQYSGIASEAGAICVLRHSPLPESDNTARSMVTLNQTNDQVEDRTAKEQGKSDFDMRKTLREFLHIPFQTATGSWLSVRLPRGDGTSSADLTAALGRLKGGLHHPSGRTYAIGRVVAGSLMAVPTAGIALGVGAGMLLDGAVSAGLLNMAFFGAIAAYGIWLVVTGVRHARGLQAAPAGAGPNYANVVTSRRSHETELTDSPQSRNESPAEGEWLHPGIRTFMDKNLRMGEPCTFDCRGTHLWGTTRDRRCENISLLLASVSACLFVGFWIPDFLNVAFGLLLLILAAVGLSRFSAKPPRQFHLDVATDPPQWFSNDDEFWRPVMAFFKLKDTPRRRFWRRRKNGNRVTGSDA